MVPREEGCNCPLERGVFTETVAWRALRPVLVLVASTSSALATAAVALPRPPGVAPTASVTCDAVVYIDPAPSPGPHGRVLLDRIALPNEDAIPRPIRRGRSGLSYWVKVGLLARGRTPVQVTVPKGWRNRLALIWGNSAWASSVRVLGCRAWPVSEWRLYTGGFKLRSPACFPLVIRAGRRTTVIRFAVGRAC